MKDYIYVVGAFLFIILLSYCVYSDCRSRGYGYNFIEVRCVKR